MFGKTNHIHFVGIGGIGMSGIAEILFKEGFKITGSDIIKNERVAYLEDLGLKINIGHNVNNINNADVLVYSSAINNKNIEIKEAYNQNIPVIKRAEILGELLKLNNKSIAVGGTHGKTTCSSMLGSILNFAKKSPTIIIGGIVNEYNSNSNIGKGNIIVVEADEFDKSFLDLRPTYSIITNLDLDHLECYHNFDDLINSFSEFANSVPFYGKIAICIDDLNNQKLMSKLKKPYTTFGLTDKSTIKAKNIEYDGMHSSFDLFYKNKFLSKITLNVPGNHNILNALGAITIALELDIDTRTISDGLSQYSGVQRRFELKHTSLNGISIIDDYAHHPTEIKETINAVSTINKNRLISIFQPHLFSRTQNFYIQFSQSLSKSDIIILTPIFAAREEPIVNIKSDLIYNEIKTSGHKNVYLVNDKNEVPELIKKIVKENDNILIMGAGDINKIIDDIITTL